MKRTQCTACGYDDLEPFLDLGMSPIADAYTADPTELAPMFPLQLAVCTGCWLVQLLEVVDHTMLFGTGYSFYSSASAPLSEYHADYAIDLLERHGPLAKGLTVEIGCNDGDLLRHFLRWGGPVIGIDPAEGPATVARNRGIPVIAKSFGMEVAQEIRSAEGPAGLIIANHVLAHVEDVADVLAGIGLLLADDGVAYIEVQYLPDLLVNNAFDLVYHEHRNFFSLTSLEAAATQWGLHVARTQLTDRQGGSLRVAFTKTRPDAPLAADQRLRASEVWLGDVAAYRGMQGRAERIRTRLWDILHTIHGQGDMVVGYGAPGKATTLLNFCGIGSDAVTKVMDTTPAKQGRYIPGTGIPIVPPERLYREDTALLLAWTYARQIISREQVGGFRGDWIVPFPAPVLL